MVTGGCLGGQNIHDMIAMFKSIKILFISIYILLNWTETSWTYAYVLP